MKKAIVALRCVLLFASFATALWALVMGICAPKGELKDLYLLLCCWTTTCFWAYVELLLGE